MDTQTWQGYNNIQLVYKAGVTAACMLSSLWCSLFWCLYHIRLGALKSCCGHALVSKDTPHSVMLSIACIAMMYLYTWENFDGIKFWRTIQGNGYWWGKIWWISHSHQTHFHCICKHWREEFWRDLTNSPIPPSKIFPFTCSIWLHMRSSLMMASPSLLKIMRLISLSVSVPIIISLVA